MGFTSRPALLRALGAPKAPRSAGARSVSIARGRSRRTATSPARQCRRRARDRGRPRSERARRSRPGHASAFAARSSGEAGSARLGDPIKRILIERVDGPVGASVPQTTPRSPSSGGLSLPGSAASFVASAWVHLGVAATAATENSAPATAAGLEHVLHLARETELPPDLGLEPSGRRRPARPLRLAASSDRMSWVISPSPGQSATFTTKADVPRCVRDDLPDLVMDHSRSSRLFRCRPTAASRGLPSPHHAAGHGSLRRGGALRLDPRPADTSPRGGRRATLRP